MSKAPYKLPSVFVGCPYGGKFPFSAFQDTLNRIPFRWYYADTHLSTKHLLGILTTYIRAVDYCIFDISLWNPNVALEIGLAEGLGVEYYILLNRKLSKGVPADIQGLQRIEYVEAKGFEADALLPSVVKYLVKEHTHPKNIWGALQGDNRESRFYFALSVLAHLRDNKYLRWDEIPRLVRGTYLRKEVQQDVLEKLETLGLVSPMTSKRGATLKKNLFPNYSRSANESRYNAFTSPPPPHSPADSPDVLRVIARVHALHNLRHRAIQRCGNKAAGLRPIQKAHTISGANTAISRQERSFSRMFFSLDFA